MGQRSQGELCTERQSNGRLTYNSAPQVRPDRFADPLLHQHGTHQASAASNAGSLGYVDIARFPCQHRHRFNPLLYVGGNIKQFSVNVAAIEETVKELLFIP